MDVRSSGGGGVAEYAAAAAALSVGIAAPALVVPAYGGLLSTLVLLLFLGLGARGVLGAALAFRFPSARAPDSLDLGPASADPPPADLPTVSVVVAAYDEEETLPATVEACRALDYPDDRLEVLLCYEAESTDATADVAESAATHPRFRALRRDAPPGGKAAMANFGIERADGDVVGFVDAGQRPEPDALRRAVRRFRSDDVWCVKGRCYGTNAGDSLVALHATVERHLVERGEFVARERLSGFTLFTGGLAFLRAEAFRELGPFDETVLLEDVEFAARIHARGKRVRVDPEIVSAETNPATLSSWWNRRKRWARGGMQAARRHLLTVPRSPRASPVVALDALHTFGSLLAVPVALLALPAVAFGYVNGGATYLPGGRLAWGFLALAALVSPLLVFERDRRDGRPHSPREYAAVLTLPAYFAVEGVAIVAAFVEEFILRRPSVYVPSKRPGEKGDGR